jgi:acetylornithine deacetylase/succinyl-diaminopimelate desuccinylase-like protein
MDVDLRSEDAAALAELDRAFAVAMARGAEDENRERSTESGRITVRTELAGSRPSGQTSDSSPLVREAAAAIRATGHVPSFGWSSTDANLPMSLGIPAITIDAGVSGGRAHAPDEWIDVERGVTIAGLRRVLLIVLGVAGIEE